MKKLIATFLSAIILFTAASPAYALSPPKYPTPRFDNVNDLIEWVNNEDIENFQEGRYQKVITSLRESGELFIPYYVDDLLQLRDIEVLTEKHFSGFTSIIYRFGIVEWFVMTSNNTMEQSTEEWALNYMRNHFGSEFDGIIHETTMGINHDEAVKYVTHDYFIPNYLDYDQTIPMPDGSGRFHTTSGIIKDKHLIFSETDTSLWSMDFINNLLFTTMPLMTAPILGDINNDQGLDMLDVALLYQYVRGKIHLSDINEAAADVNQDGTVNILDVTALYQYAIQKMQAPNR